MNCNSVFFLVPSLSLINIKLVQAVLFLIFFVQNILTNRYRQSQFSYFTSNFLVFKCRHDIFPQRKLSQGLAGHILFMLVSAFLVFCPFFFLFQGLVSNSSGLEGSLWQMGGKWSHQCTCANPLLMVAHPSCIRPSLSRLLTSCV